MIQITDKSKCCGCTACYSVCPKKCITMKPDFEGFLYPEVNLESCVDCHACEKVCPMSGTKGKVEENSLFVGAQYLDEQKRQTSTAGGAFSLVADYLIDQGATVFAVGYDNEVVVCHKQANSKDQLAEMRGSKYVQSYLGDTYRQVKKCLDIDNKVLFVGTPCQVHGLINFLGGGHANLYTIDLLCLGVSSPRIFADYVSYLKKKYNISVSHIEFRNKYFGYSTPNVRVCFKNGKYIQQKYDSKCHANLFFQKHLNARPSCYECAFREVPRVSDFTIGDFTNIGAYNKSMDDDKGTTRLWIHTDKGKHLLDAIGNKQIFVLTENTSNIIGGSKKQIPYPREREEFFYDSCNLGFAEFINKWQPPRLKDNVVGVVRYILHYMPFGHTEMKVMRKRQAARFDKNVRKAEKM
ncbi:MAG: Coenzyme F420 hydrogenase/dehydrogenase, beta subunit C-terminal domain [Sphaerochaeta sp.]